MFFDIQAKLLAALSSPGPHPCFGESTSAAERLQRRSKQQIQKNERERVAWANMCYSIWNQKYFLMTEGHHTLWYSNKINSSAKAYGIMENRNSGFFVLQNEARVSKTNVSKAEMTMQTTDNSACWVINNHLRICSAVFISLQDFFIL